MAVGGERSTKHDFIYICESATGSPLLFFVNYHLPQDPTQKKIPKLSEFPEFTEISLSS